MVYTIIHVMVNEIGMSDFWQKMEDFVGRVIVLGWLFLWVGLMGVMVVMWVVVMLLRLWNARMKSGFGRRFVAIRMDRAHYRLHLTFCLGLRTCVIWPVYGNNKSTIYLWTEYKTTKICFEISKSILKIHNKCCNKLWCNTVIKWVLTFKWWISQFM